MSTLTEFRDHCRRMAEAEHKPECKWPDWGKADRYNRMQATFERMFSEEPGSRGRAVHCPGCNPAADRALFARLAGELDDYLAPAVDLFGEVTVEPMTEEFGMDERKAVGHE